ncbi:MAG: DsbA family protein [Bifidobacteriaceae bacterium]|jgi:protein-disulfide isomerase|nr:DsbA family protein [Bifidobacteriaceae bacterium]
MSGGKPRPHADQRSSSGRHTPPKAPPPKRDAVVYWLVGIVAATVVFSVAWVTRGASGGSPAATGASTAQTTSSGSEAPTPGPRPTDGSNPAEQAVMVDDAVVIGASEAPVTVDIYLDYICPGCGAFEKINRVELRDLVESGQARLRLHLLTFLDDASSGTRYSTRAANAMVEVVERAPAAALAFHEALFANQPAEGSEGLTDETIAELAREAGAPAEVIAKFGALSQDERLTTEMTRVFAEDGIKVTPTVMIQGEKFSGDLFSVGPLTRAIQAAAGE